MFRNLQGIKMKRLKAFKSILMIVSLMLSAGYGLSAQHIDLTEPANNSFCVSPNVTFEWSISLGTAEYYGIEVSETSSFTNLVVNETQLTEAEYTTVLPKNETAYYWRVSCTFTNGARETSGAWLFETKVAPPEHVVPADDAECQSNSPTFEWMELTDAEEYTLQISTSSSFTTLIAEVESISSTSYTYNDLPEYETEYFWRVSAKLSDDCETDFSAPWSFETAQRPPTLLSPGNNDVGQPLTLDLTWGGATSALYYELQVDDNADFSSPVSDLTNITSNSQSITLPQLNTSYYWHVRAVYADCITDYSAPRMFKTQYRAPLLIDPNHSEYCVELTDDYSWEALQEAESYRLQISEDEDFSTLEVNRTGIESSFTSATLSSPYTAYHWRVRAEDNDNVGVWSESRSFTSSLNPPTHLFPDDELTGLPLEFTLVWDEEIPGSVYRLQVATDPGFETNDIIIAENNLTDASYDISVDDNFTEYYWRLQAKYSVCSSSWSEPTMFKTVVGPPELYTPEDEAVNQALKPLFQWERVEGAISYEINLSTSASFNQVDMGRRGILANSFSFIDELEIGTLYYWRIRASNNEGTSVWSETFSFTTGGRGPTIPELVSPEDEAVMIDLPPTLVWNQSLRADSYLVQVSTNKNFIGYVVDAANVTDTTFEVDDLDNYREYYWRVAAVNDSGRSVWSEEWQFRTIALIPGDAPELWTPLNNTTGVPIDMIFSWYPADRAEGYHLRVGTESDLSGTLIIDNDKVWGTNARVYDLPGETDIYWRVAAWNEAGKGPWSETWKFTTNISSVDDGAGSPFASAVYPNPFAGSAIISFTLPEASNVSIKIYNAMGSEIITVLDEYRGSGEHNVSWDPAGLESGMYVYTISAGGKQETKRMIYVR